MKKMIVAAVFASFLMIPEFAAAQGRFHNSNQRVRIQNGVRQGQLTRLEGKHVVAQQHRIKSMKRMAMADGIVTARERLMIRKAEQRASLAIRQQKYDRNYRW